MCVSGRDRCRAGRDLLVLWTDDLLGGLPSGSETKDQSPSLLQSEAPSCTYGLWSPAASRAVLWAALRLARGPGRGPE